MKISYASNYGIVIHGGAGSISPALRKDHSLRKKILTESVSQGFHVIERGGSSTDAVEEAIKILEDSAIFNAGSGSSLTLDGMVEPDAAIMKDDLSCGAVANASVVKNPISLARLVMEKTDHVFMAGPSALQRLLKATGFKQYTLRPSSIRMKEYSQNLVKMLKRKEHAWPNNSKLLSRYGLGDTVGAVALDSTGHFSAGVSTGGRFMKLPGRIGDSAVVGSGLYAESKSGGASATGMGEDIIRVCLCKTVCDLMKKGMDAQRATNSSINMISRVIGKDVAGVIAIDRNGRVGISRNTRVMPNAYLFSNMKEATITVY